MRNGRDHAAIALWGGLAAGLAAVALTAGNLEDLWPAFNTGLLAATGCGVALTVRWVRRRFWQHAAAARDALRARRALKQAEANSARLDDLELWRAVHTDRIRANEQRIDGAYQVMAEANKIMGLPDPDATAPMEALRRLYAVRDQAS